LNTPRKNELTLAELEQIAKSMPKFPWLLLSGGEPFLRDDLAGIVEIFYRFNRITNVTIPTAGIYPDRVAAFIGEAAKLESGIDFNINFSVYGPQPVHEGVTGVAGSYSKTLACIDRVAKLTAALSNFRLAINVPLIASNETTFRDTLREMRSRFPNIRLNPGIARGMPKEERELEVDPQTYRKGVDDLWSNQPPGRVMGRIFSLRNRFMHERIYATKLGNAKYRDCNAGQLSFVVSEYGDVFSCELIDQKLGNLRDCGYDFKKIYNSAARKRFVESIKANRCTCTHECNQTVNSLYDWVLLKDSLLALLRPPVR
jgi:radical SAM protein with 4Fe4S-binding SPASM domain